MASTTVYPNGDGSRTGTWTPSTGTTYYNLIDETPADDADFVSTTSQNAIIYFDFQNMPSDFGTATAVDIHIRTKTGTKGDYLRWDHVQLVSNDESTSITNTAAMTSGNIAFTDYTYSPSIIGSTTKTTWDGIRLKVKTSTGTTSSCQVSQAYLTITYTVSSGNTYNQTGSGGSLIAGSASNNTITNKTASGGSLIAGSASNNTITNKTASGGMLIGGSSNSGLAFDEIASGGSLIAGSASNNLIKTDVLSGGILIGGSALIATIINEQLSGGVVLSGQAAFTTTVSIGGGSLISGSALINKISTINSNGGVVVSGLSLKTDHMTHESSSGIEIAGQALCRYRADVPCVEKSTHNNKIGFECYTSFSSNSSKTCYKSRSLYGQMRVNKHKRRTSGMVPAIIMCRQKDYIGL